MYLNKVSIPNDKLCNTFYDSVLLNTASPYEATTADQHSCYK